MEEPARQIGDDGHKATYDEPTGVERSSPLPELKAIEGGGETTEPKRGHLSPVEDSPPSRGELADAEENPADQPIQHEQTLGAGYKPTMRGSKKSKGRLLSLSRRKKWGMGIGGGILGAGIISIILLLLPALRLEGYLAGINKRVYAAANNAVQQRTEKLFEQFMIRRLLAMDKCGGVVTSACRVDYANMGYASNLFKSWQDAKIEDKLINEYGFSIESRPKPAPGQPRFRIVDKNGNEIKLSAEDAKNGNFLNGNRAMGKEINAGLKAATRWDQVLERRAIRKYLARAHNIKFWCLFACNQKDAIDTARITAKAKLQYKLLEKFVYPFTPKYALIMKCLVSADPSVCSPKNLNKTSLDTSKLSKEDLKSLEAFSQRLEKEPGLKLSQIAIEQILIKAGMDEATAKSVTSAVPLVGQVYLVLSAMEAMEGVKTFVENGELTKIAANLTSEQYVQYYAAMRTANDEIKSGSLPANEVGALNSQFDDGGHPAEQSLVYQAYNNPKSTAASATSNSPISSLFGKSKVLAEATSPPYACSNGQPIPAGQLVCPEKTLNRRGNQLTDFFASDTFKTISSVLDNYDRCYGIHTRLGCAGANPHHEVHAALGAVNWLINGVLGSILSVAVDAIKLAPGINNFLNFATNEAGKLIISLFKEAFPLPLQADSNGIDKYNGLEAGGEITASEFNKGGYMDSGQSYGLGGQLLTDQQQADASQAYLTQQDYDYHHSSIVARLTNMNNPSSPLSRFVAAMPNTWNEFSSNVFSFISNPFKNFSVIWQPAYAAANTADINAFGVPRFGYTANDPVFNADPSLYTPEYCQQLEQKWQASKTQDPVTGIDEYSTTNPCLLEQVSVESASSVFTQNESLDE